MRNVPYEDDVGRKFMREIPDDAPDVHAMYGVNLGPPDLSSLNLPLQMEVRLNNALFNRGLFTVRDVHRRRAELQAVWQHVLQVDVVQLTNLYEGALG